MTNLPPIVLGLLLERMRKEKGLSQVQLAEKAHLNQSAVSRIESGKLEIGVFALKAYMDVLGKAPQEILASVDDLVKKTKLTAKACTKKSWDKIQVGEPAIRCLVAFVIEVGNA